MAHREFDLKVLVTRAFAQLRDVPVRWPDDLEGYMRRKVPALAAAHAHAMGELERAARRYRRGHGTVKEVHDRLADLVGIMRELAARLPLRPEAWRGRHHAA